MIIEEYGGEGGGGYFVIQNHMEFLYTFFENFLSYFSKKNLVLSMNDVIF